MTLIYSLPLLHHLSTQQVMSLRTFSVPTLRPNNYEKWLLIMKPYLDEEGISITEDLDAKTNGKALRIIRGSLSDEVLPFVASEETAKATWLTLHRLYGTPNLEGQQVLLQRFLQCKMSNSETMQVYFARVQALANRLNSKPVVKNEHEQIKILIPEPILLAVLINGLNQDLRSEVQRWSMETLSVENLLTRLETLPKAYRPIILRHQSDKSTPKCAACGGNHLVIKCDKPKCPECHWRVKHRKGCLKGNSRPYAKLSSVGKSVQIKAILDSGANFHLTGDPSLIRGLSANGPTTVNTAAGEAPVHGTGYSTYLH